MIGISSTEVHFMGDFLIGRIKKEDLTTECEEAYIRGVKDLQSLIDVRNKEKIEFILQGEAEND